MRKYTFIPFTGGLQDPLTFRSGVAMVKAHIDFINRHFKVLEPTPFLQLTSKSCHYIAVRDSYRDSWGMTVTTIHYFMCVVDDSGNFRLCVLTPPAAWGKLCGFYILRNDALRCLAGHNLTQTLLQRWTSYEKLLTDILAAATFRWETAHPHTPYLPPALQTTDAKPNFILEALRQHDVFNRMGSPQERYISKI